MKVEPQTTTQGNVCDISDVSMNAIEVYCGIRFETTLICMYSGLPTSLCSSEYK
jgi:hypothetical protein